MKFKRILAMLAAAAMCLSMAGCGDKDSDDEKEPEKSSSVVDAEESVSDENNSVPEVTEDTSSEESEEPDSSEAEQPPEEVVEEENIEGQVNMTQIEKVVATLWDKDLDEAEEILSGELGFSTESNREYDLEDFLKESYDKNGWPYERTRYYYYIEENGGWPEKILNTDSMCYISIMEEYDSDGSNRSVCYVDFAFFPADGYDVIEFDLLLGIFKGDKDAAEDFDRETNHSSDIDVWLNEDTDLPCLIRYWEVPLPYNGKMSNAFHVAFYNPDSTLYSRVKTNMSNAS